MTSSWFSSIHPSIHTSHDFLPFPDWIRGNQRKERHLTSRMRLTVTKLSSSIIFSSSVPFVVRSSISLPVTGSPSLIRRDSRSIIPRRSVYTGYFTNNHQSRRMSGYSSDYVSEKLKQNLKTTHLVCMLIYAAGISFAVYLFWIPFWILYQESE